MEELLVIPAELSVFFAVMSLLTILTFKAAHYKKTIYSSHQMAKIFACWTVLFTLKLFNFI